MHRLLVKITNNNNDNKGSEYYLRMDEETITKIEYECILFAVEVSTIARHYFDFELYIVLKKSYIILLSNLSIFNLPGDGHSRTASCALN